MNRESKHQKIPKIQQTVLQQLAILKMLDMDALHDKWNELFGTEPPKYKKHFLVRRLAWRIQEMYFGGLNEATQEALASLIAKDSVATQRHRFQRSQSQKQLLPWEPDLCASGKVNSTRWKCMKVDLYSKDGHTDH